MADLATARICGVLGWAPMSLKQPDTGKTYSNLVEANKASWRDAVIPFLDLVAGELTRLVQTLPIACNGMTAQPDESLCVRFDTSQIEELSVDRKALMDIATAGVNAGIFTVNEARATLGLGEMEEPEEVEAVEPEEPTTDATVDLEMEAK
jgi:hypothetical protein